MEAHLQRFAFFCCVLCVFTALGTVHYVDVNGTNAISPYTDWSRAATNIQDAVDAALDSDTILVADGVYNSGGRRVAGDSTTNRLAVTKAVVVQSINGPTATVIQGYRIPGTTNGPTAIRCVYLTNNTLLAGFTLTGGATGQYFPSGGGAVMCSSGSAVVSNCMVVGNAGINGGGILNGTILDCTIVSNYSYNGGGGAANSTLANCLLGWNTTPSDGGGAFYCTLTNCILATNSALPNAVGVIAGGGGAYNCSLTDCTIKGNTTTGSGGGILSGTAMNCVLAGNNSTENGGGSAVSTLNNCLVVGNTGNGSGGVFSGSFTCCVIVSNYCALCGNAGADVGVANNSIVRYNFNTNTPGIEKNYNSYSFSYINSCCTWPMPAGVGHLSGNITNDPSFVNLAAGDYHLQSNSPCINSGNNAYVTTATDLDSNTRIVGATVDIGAYEYQSPTSLLSYAWLQQYGLPTDGSADFIDADGDGMNNWQEWIAGTNPTNALSAFRMVSATNSSSGAVVSWQSVSTRNYFIQRANDFGVRPGFTTVATNIAGQNGTTTFTDTNATGAGPFIYRAGVQH